MSLHAKPPTANGRATSGKQSRLLLRPPPLQIPRRRVSRNPRPQTPTEHPPSPPAPPYLRTFKTECHCTPIHQQPTVEPHRSTIASIAASTTTAHPTAPCHSEPTSVLKLQPNIHRYLLQKPAFVKGLDAVAAVTVECHGLLSDCHCRLIPSARSLLLLLSPPVSLHPSYSRMFTVHLCIVGLYHLERDVERGTITQTATSTLQRFEKIPLLCGVDDLV